MVSCYHQPGFFEWNGLAWLYVWSFSLVVWPNWKWVVSKVAPWRELSNAPKNVGFRWADQKLWSFEVASLRFDGFWWWFSNDVNFSNKWKFPWKKLLKIGRSVARKLIYNLVKIDCVFIKWFMCYIHFCGDGFFWFVHT